MFDEEFIVILAAFGIVFSVFFGLIVFTINWDCGKFQEATGRQTKVTGMQCYAMTNDGWIPPDQIRNTK